MNVSCPYCKRPAVLTDSAEVYQGRSYGMIWLCWPCDAYVGCHKYSRDHVPLGRLANAELRKWKVKAHYVFDKLWLPKETAPMKRKKAYKLMQQKMGLSPANAHIGFFNVAECKRLIEVLTNQEKP